jgi:hypothetical protein
VVWRSKARSSVLCWEQPLPFGAPARPAPRLYCHWRRGLWWRRCHRQWASLPLLLPHRAMVTCSTWDIATYTPCCLWWEPHSVPTSNLPMLVQRPWSSGVMRVLAVPELHPTRRVAAMFWTHRPPGRQGPRTWQRLRR